MKNIEQQKLLKLSKRHTKTFKPKTIKKTNIYEGNFVSNAIKKSKNFLKKQFKNVVKNAKNVYNHLKKEYMSNKKPENFLPGKMLAFQYSAKDVNKRFDKSPLVICLGRPKNKKLQHTHTLGLNLHWLPAKDRVNVASFFTELLEKRGGKLEYKDIKPFLSKFKGHPVLRMYIIKNISPKVIEMPTEQYLVAASVPSEQWGGK